VREEKVKSAVEKTGVDEFICGKWKKINNRSRPAYELRLNGYLLGMSAAFFCVKGTKGKIYEEAEEEIDFLIELERFYCV